MLAALPPGHRQDLSPQARWLFRTLRAAELAGLDPAEVIRTAIASRDLAGARDIAAVLDARIRPRVDPLLPQPQGPWASRVPRLPDPARQAYLAEIAAMMDDRTQRLGQHAAQTGPAWAVTALGPVPADPAARRAWQTKAAAIAAYREMYGYDHPDDPIGPEPSHADAQTSGPPGTRPSPPSARPTAPTSAPCPTAGCGCSATPTPPQTAWAPRHVGKELRLARLGAFDAALGAIRADAEAARRPQGRRPRPRRTARDPGRQLPGPARPLPAAGTDPRPGHGRPAGMGARHRRSRHLAIAADAELRRRHPGQKIEPLRSAEPAPVTDTERDGKPSQTATRIGDLAAQHHAFRQRTGQRDTLAASYRVLRDLYQQRELTLAQATADRQAWEYATAASRHLAIAADTELRRRYPGHKIEPLRSAEPLSETDTERDGRPSETAARIRDLAAQHHAFRQTINQRQHRLTPRNDLDWAALGDTLPSWWVPHRDAILRPPKPEITPSAKILQFAAEQNIELEAGS